MGLGRQPHLTVAVFLLGLVAQTSVRAQTAEQLVSEYGVAGLLELVPTGPPERCSYSIEYSPAVDYSLDDAPRTFDAPGTLALLALARNLVAEERANLQE